MNIRSHEFNESLEYSLQFAASVEAWLARYVRENVGYSGFAKNTTRGNDHGVDWFLHRTTGAVETIDDKVRSQWYGPDLCIETTSVWHGEFFMGVRHDVPDDSLRRKPGWTVDQDKQTDFILWQWPDPKDSTQRRFRFDAFSQLRTAAVRCYPFWKDSYGERAIANRGYSTLIMCVPIKVVDKAMRNL